MNQRREQILNYVGKTLLLFLFMISLSALSAKSDRSSSRANHSQTINAGLRYSKAVLRQAGPVFSGRQLPVFRPVFPFFAGVKRSNIVSRIADQNFVSLEKDRQAIAPLLFPGFCYFSHRPRHPAA